MPCVFRGDLYGIPHDSISLIEWLGSEIKVSITS